MNRYFWYVKNFNDLFTDFRFFFCFPVLISIKILLQKRKQQKILENFIG